MQALAEALSILYIYSWWANRSAYTLQQMLHSSCDAGAQWLALPTGEARRGLHAVYIRPMLQAYACKWAPESTSCSA
jgi:hypothetical protein